MIVTEVILVLAKEDQFAEVIYDRETAQLDTTCPTCQGTGFVGEGKNRSTCDNCTGTGLESGPTEKSRVAAPVVLREIVPEKA